MSKKKFYKSFLVLTVVLLLFQILSLYSFAQQSENSDPSVYADADPSADPSGGEQAGKKLKAYPGAEGFGAYSYGSSDSYAGSNRRADGGADRELVHRRI